MSFNPCTRTELGYSTCRPSAGPLGPVTDAVKHQVGKLNDSGKYYCTAEMSTELRHIRHGCENINFDHDLLSTSGPWHQINKPGRRKDEVQGMFIKSYIKCTSQKSLSRNNPVTFPFIQPRTLHGFSYIPLHEKVVLAYPLPE